MKTLVKLKQHVNIPKLKSEEGVFIVEKYFQNKIFLTVQRKFRLTFNRESPCKKSI